ncbi:MAG: carbon-nitrogen hydrolase family protein [Candidatus Bathyarchaeia archaeon]
MREFESYIPHFKLAAAQVAPVYMNRAETVEKACHVVEEAAKNGANIVGFPECFIPGFPTWVYAGSPIYDTLNFFEQYVKNSVEIPSKWTDILCDIAKQNQIYIVIGMSEKDRYSSSTLFQTQLFISNKGEILGRHRKIVPTYAEKLIFTGGDGSTLSVFKTEYGELGGLNCGENNNPLAKFALIAQGIKIHVASWPMPGAFPFNFRDMIIPCVREFAYEAKAFVINSSAVVTPEIKETLLEYAKTAKPVFERDIQLGGGVSCIISPMFGRVIAQADPEKEMIVYADCDLSEHYKSKANHDLLGNYNRPDIFKFIFNKKAQRLVEVNETIKEGVNYLLELLPIEKRKALEERASAEGKSVDKAIMDLIENYLKHANPKS